MCVCSLRKRALYRLVHGIRMLCVVYCVHCIVYKQHFYSICSLTHIHLNEAALDAQRSLLSVRIACFVHIKANQFRENPVDGVDVSDDALVGTNISINGCSRF